LLRFSPEGIVKSGKIRCPKPMSVRLVNVDRDTPLLFPADFREWLPENYLVHLIIEAVEGLDLNTFKVNSAGSGSEQYPSGMMVMLLLELLCDGADVQPGNRWGDVYRMRL
jgi:transposase